MPQLDPPEIDRVLDKMLTNKRDPLERGEFPSLGFANERRGAYFIQVEHGDILVSVWKLTQPNGAPDKYNINTYGRCVHNGVASWGGAVKNALVADSLIQVQAIIHHIITSGGNQHEAK